MAQLSSASMVDAPKCGKVMHLEWFFNKLLGKSQTYPDNCSLSKALTTA